MLGGVLGGAQIEGHVVHHCPLSMALTMYIGLREIPVHTFRDPYTSSIRLTTYPKYPVRIFRVGVFRLEIFGIH